jgi:hypothetical protein
MLVLSVYLITGSAISAVYWRYRQIQNRPLSLWWQAIESRTYRLFFVNSVFKPHQERQRGLQSESVLQAEASSAAEEKTGSLEESDEAGEEFELFEQGAQSSWGSPDWARVWLVERESLVRVQDLCQGDTVLVDAGEMIPTQGVILSGSAWVLSRQDSLSVQYPAVDIPVAGYRVSIGDRVHALEIVLVGSLRIAAEVSGRV